MHDLPTTPGESDDFDSLGLWETSSSSRVQAGDFIDDYKLISVLGEGGMGRVFLAEQRGVLRRQVAIKLIKRGMDTAQVLNRFEFERQTLAQLSHHAVARVLDAGETPMGSPYFVMEFVDGLPINHYCDKHRMTITERLGLFMTVCDAVRHAHQKLIIHRDLKPSNIIVTMEGRQPLPKVIDWGIAKAIDVDTSKTVTNVTTIIGTPEYMSPEQAAHDAPDTRADIYSLGVILYELLCGRLPFDSAWLREQDHAIATILREVVPPRPSRQYDTVTDQLLRETIAKRRQLDPKSVRPAISGELDWIVMKSIAKSRDERYASVGELADDIRRFMNREPVSAGPPSGLYRLRKLALKHRPLSITAALVAGALMVGFLLAILRGNAALDETRLQLEATTAAITERDAAIEERDTLIVQLRDTIESEDGTLNPEFTGPEAHALEVRDRQVALARVGLAHRDARAGRLSQARSMLDAADEVRDTWPWRYVDALLGSGAKDIVTGTDFTPVAYFNTSGDRAVVVSGTHGVLYNTLDGSIISPLGTMPLTPSAASFHPTSEFAASILASDAAHRITILHTDTGAPIATIETDVTPSAIRFAPNGARLAVSLSDGSIAIYSTSDWTAERTIALHADAMIEQFAWSYDSTRVVAATGVGGTWVVPVVPEAEPQQLSETNSSAAAWSRDGSLIAAAGDDGAVRIFNAADGAVTQTLRGQALAATGLVFCADGARIASVDIGALRIWDTERGTLLAEYPEAQLILSDGQLDADEARLIAADSSGGLFLVYTRSGVITERFGSLGTRICTARFSDDDDVLMAASVGGLLRRELREPTGRPHVTIQPSDSWIRTAVFSPDASTVFTGSGHMSAGGTPSVDMWSAANGRHIKTLFTADTPIADIAVSIDGMQMVCVLGDGSLQLRSIHDGRLIRSYTSPTGRAFDQAVFGIDESIFARAADRTVYGYDSTSDTTTPARTYERRSDFQLTSLATDPLGTHIVAGSRDRSLSIWSPGNAAMQHHVTVLESFPEDVEIGSDGALIATCGGLRAQIIDVTARSISREVYVGKGVMATNLIAEERLLITGTTDAIQVWDVAAGDSLLTLPIPARRGGPAIAGDMRDIRVSSDRTRIGVVHAGGVLIFNASPPAQPQ